MSDAARAKAVEWFADSAEDWEIKALTTFLDEFAAERTAALREALKRAHACATLRDDGTCDGCFVSAALLADPEEPR